MTASENRVTVTLQVQRARADGPNDFRADAQALALGPAASPLPPSREPRLGLRELIGHLASDDSDPSSCVNVFDCNAALRVRRLLAMTFEVDLIDPLDESNSVRGLELVDVLSEDDDLTGAGETLDMICFWLRHGGQVAASFKP